MIFLITSRSNSATLPICFEKRIFYSLTINNNFTTMKKFFTLFALLSVGLSAWAQTYTLELHELTEEEEFVYFSHAMKEGTNGIYTLDKYVYLYGPEEIYNEEEGYDEPGDPIEYQFVVKDNNNERVDVLPYPIGDVESAGWYLFYFRYTPESGLYLDNSEGPLFEIIITDDLSFATEGTLEIEEENIEYRRSNCNQWGTLCLQFNFMIENQYDVTFYQIESVADGVMTFTPYDQDDEIWGGTPVVFKLDEGNDDLVVSQSGAYPYIASKPEPSYTDAGWTMQGTFESINSGSNIYYYLSKDATGDGVFYGKNITIPPYRAWFTAPDDYNPAPLRISIDDTEGLQFVEQEDGTVKVYYDLQGRKLDEAQKGLKIENGKVIMVK